MPRPAKVQAILLCEDVKINNDRARISGCWQKMRCRAFPAQLQFKIFVMLTGDLFPTVCSVTIAKEDGEQISRDVTTPPTSPTGEPLSTWEIRTPMLQFPAAGWYSVKIDADGISPAAFDFELVLEK